MVSNYPPGVTGNESRIAGKSHYRQCPMHEDAEVVHTCAPPIKMPHTVEWDGYYWKLIIVRNYPLRTVINFCPYCGEELAQPHCTCDEIAESRTEEAAARYEE